jgi:hypothetical protein
LEEIKELYNKNKEGRLPSNIEKLLGVKFKLKLDLL